MLLEVAGSQVEFGYGVLLPKNISIPPILATPDPFPKGILSKICHLSLISGLVGMDSLKPLSPFCYQKILLFHYIISSQRFISSQKFQRSNPESYFSYI